MKIEIKIGDRKELQHWVSQQKKNGNVVRYVAVDDPSTGERLLVLLKSNTLMVKKTKASQTCGARYVTGPTVKALGLRIQEKPFREEIRSDAKAYLINAVKTGEKAATIASQLRMRARMFMFATTDQLVAFLNTLSHDPSEGTAILTLESLTGYLLGMAELINPPGNEADKPEP